MYMFEAIYSDGAGNTETRNVEVENDWIGIRTMDIWARAAKEAVIKTPENSKTRLTALYLLGITGK